MVQFFRIFVIFTLILLSTCTNLLQDSNFVIDFIARQNCSPKIIAVTCFTKDELLSMTKVFSKRFLSITYLRYDTFTKDLYFYKGRCTFLLDARCEQHKNMLNQVSDMNDRFGHQYFNESFDWIILGENKLNNSILNSTFYCGVNSKVYLVDIKEEHYKIDAIFKYTKQDYFISKNNVGLWTVKSGFVYFNMLNLACDRSNLNGLDIRVIYPYKFSSELAHGYDFRQIGNKNLLVNIILFKILLTRLNATYVPIFFDLSLDNTLITMNNALFLHLKSGLGDIIGIPLTIVKERLQDFRYLIPSSPNTKAFIFRVPTLAFIRNIYVMPFYKTAWYCLWGVLSIATLVLFFMDVVYQKLPPDVEIHLSFFDIIMIQISALFQKSSNWELKSLSGRIATGFLYMSLMIITVSYSACLVVYLQATAEDITDLKNLYESGIKMGSENITYDTYQNLMSPRNNSAEEFVRQGIILSYNNKLNHSFIMPIETGMNNVQTQFFAFYTFLESAYDVIANTFEEYEKCSIRTTPGFYGEKDKYLMAAKNSTLTDFYRIGFRKIIESGLQRREYLKHYRQKPKCENTGLSNFSGTGIVETKAIFLTFIIGAMLSFLLFLLEQLFYNYILRICKNYNQSMKCCDKGVIQPYVD